MWSGTTSPGSSTRPSGNSGKRSTTVLTPLRLESVPLRQALAAVQPYRPQRPMRELQEELGLERLGKLASNEGAFRPLPAAVAAFEASVGGLNRYPDGGGVRLREALAERHRLDPSQVVLGNGADELIRLCAVATLDADDVAAFFWPSFPSYVSAAACSGGQARRVAVGDLDALLGARLIYIANPNNPAGTLLDAAELRRFLGAAAGLCVLDEAYAEYADPEPEGPQLLREGAERLCVLRTFSKVHGLAALRIGYALASAEVADALDRVRSIFNVNKPAQEAALASLHEREALVLRVEHARRGRRYLHEVLAEAGLEPQPSQANFVYADAGDGEELARRLLHEGVIVRALTGFGAPEAIRVTSGTDEENRLFAEALGRIIV